MYMYVYIFSYIGLINATEHLRGEFHNSEVLVTSTLLALKAKNIF